MQLMSASHWVMSVSCNCWGLRYLVLGVIFAVFCSPQFKCENLILIPPRIIATNAFDSGCIKRKAWELCTAFLSLSTISHSLS